MNGVYIYIYIYIHVMWCNVDVDGMYYIPYIYSMYIIQTIQKFMDDHMPTFISTISRSCKHPKTIDSMGEGKKYYVVYSVPMLVHLVQAYSS